MRLNAFEKLNALKCFIFTFYLHRFLYPVTSTGIRGKRWSWLMVRTIMWAATAISAHIISGIITSISSSVFSQLASIRSERALLSALCPEVAAEHRRIALIFLFYHRYYCLIYFIMPIWPICLSFWTIYWYIYFFIYHSTCLC